MTRDAAISRSVLSDQVKDRLLQAILDGRYPPGARIVETRVARERGTSQAPVREALRDLEALGVVETAAFRGARVRRPSADELLEAFVVRAELESLAARLAIPSITDADLEELAALRSRLADAGSLVGESDHGVSKSLYARDPDGIEFEVMWAVPRADWPAQVGTFALDLAGALARWPGVDTADE